MLELIKTMLETVKKELSAKILILLFLAYSLIWIYLTFSQQPGSVWHDVFNNLYGTIAFFGGIIGLIVSARWGGFKSWTGRTIVFISLGLLAQEFGQLSYNFYRYVLHFEETPYPSVGDFGYWASIVFYILGLYSIGQIAGVKAGLRSARAKLIAISIPVIVLLIIYLLFLRELTLDWTQPLIFVLDAIYPVAQAINVSAFLIVYLLSRKYMGGVMRSRVLFLIGAYVMQYLADFNFLYQINAGSWSYCGIGDYLYMVAYFLMSFGLIQLKMVFDKINNTKTTK